MSSQVTKSGRIMSISALVAAGNRNGLAGFAVGRGSTSDEAQRKAMRKAAKRLVFVPRLFEESLFQDTEGTIVFFSFFSSFFFGFLSALF